MNASISHSIKHATLSKEQQAGAANMLNPFASHQNATNSPEIALAATTPGLSPQENMARNQLLHQSVFPDWQDDASGRETDSPEEMQKKDPLATQIWKLYSKTKTRLPNQERMENLTWRMMAMSLRRREQMQLLSVSLAILPE